MKMIKAVVRPEKCSEVLKKLGEAGFRAATRFEILGRGKQQGLKVENIYYSEIPKDMILLVINDKDVDKALEVIVGAAKSGEEGSFGDGKIFVLPVEKAVTISSGKSEL